MINEVTAVRRRRDYAPGPLDKHVTFLVSDLSGGGVQRIVTILAKEFAARGARVDVVVCASGGELAPDLPAEVRVVPLRRSSAITGIW